MINRLTLLFILLSASPGRSFCQGLLLNGGFEEENTCTEYQIACAPEAWIVSNNAAFSYFKDAGRSHSGSHCFAVEAGHARKPFLRTYVRSRLVCGLRKGNLYRFELYVKSRHLLLDSMGVYFTSYDFLLGTANRRKIVPSFYFIDAGKAFVRGDTNWQKMSFDYRATGNEIYCTIGNFSRRDVRGETGIPMVNQFFVFLDDISLTPVDRHEQLCVDWLQAKEDIYAQNERHEWLDRHIRTYQRSGTLPEPPVLQKNQLVAVDTLILPDILFESGKAGLHQRSFRVLDSICRQATGKKVDSLVVRGHADNTGTPAFNRELSLNRANAVATYLRSCLHLHASRVFTYGLADQQPIESNQTAEGRRKNRRVEILLYTRE